MKDVNICPACQGKGKKQGIACGASGCKTGDWTCLLCQGEGTVTDQEKEWFEVGRWMRDRRVTRGRTLRQEATERGMTMTVLADMEHGRIEPVPSHIDGDSEPKET